MKQMYEFDPDGDVMLILDTSRLAFHWRNDVLRVDTEKKKEGPEELSEASEGPLNNRTEKLLRGLSGGIGPKANAKAETYGGRDSTTPELAKDVTRPPQIQASERPMGEIDQLRGDPIQVQMRVSSRHLILVSPVFRKMLNGSWKERQSQNSEVCYIRSTNWDLDAFIVLFDIVHNHNRNVPKFVNIDMLAKFAIIVDYYQCHEAVEVFVDIWLEKMKKDIPNVYGKDSILWLMVSWVFSRSEIFTPMTGLMLKNCKQPVQVLELPIPEVVLNRIENKRQKSLSEIFLSLYCLLDSLLYQQECTFECSSILLGSLIKEMTKSGFLKPQVTEPFYDYSVSDIKTMVYGFKSPQWHHQQSRYGQFELPHPCTIITKVGPIIENVYKGLKGLKLEDFKCQ